MQYLDKGVSQRKGERILKTIGCWIPFLFLVSCATLPEDAGSSPDEKAQRILYEGGWVGNLDVGVNTLRIAFSIARTEEEYQAWIDSPDQGAFNLAVDKIEESETGLVLSSSTVKGTLEIRKPGTPQPSSLEAVWKQSGQEFPLVLEKRPLPLTWQRRQDPVGPLPYVEEEVSFDGAPGVRLAGSLTIPDAARFPGPRALVILVSGSGPQDRNESLLGHKPFLIMADYLTRRGIAVLRYDDRGTAESTGRYKGSKLDDFANDAAGAYRFAESRGFQRIGYLGHSEGGLILGKIYKTLKTAPGFMISLAGPAVSGKEVLLAQNKAIMLTQGYSPSAADQANTVNEGIYQILLDERDNGKAKATLETTYRTLGFPQAAADQQIATLLDPWFRDFLTYDPQADLRLLPSVSPVLAVYGSLDVQVLSNQNAPVFETFLEEAAVPGSRVKVFEGKNHLFQPAKTGGLQEYSSIETTMDEEVLEFLCSWILEVTRGR